MKKADYFLPDLLNEMCYPMMAHNLISIVRIGEKDQTPLSYFEWIILTLKIVMQRTF